jgi:serine/threonine protein kinase
MEANQAPQRFGRYVLLDRMGAGGMAEVFRAVVPGAEGFRRDLVVKRILSDRASAANFIEMFVHEARISALLHHPNVVQVFDFGQVDGSYFLAMELLRGRDLLAIFRSLRERQRPFPIPIAVHVAQQVALGLGYAHALTSPDGKPLNIIHRDVSPANIMCLRAGGVKLLDFGIAQAIGEMDSDESGPSSFKGKLCYMAPERLRDGPQDGRVDLFSLGAVLWEMLAGRRLFHGQSEAEKVRSVLDKPVPPPSTFRSEVPASLDEIVLKALARDPDQRYAAGQTLADDLEAVLGEVKYQSRMLPAFLNELFGSAPSAAHIALSMASPELLAFDPTTTPPATQALAPSGARVSTVSRSVTRLIRVFEELRPRTKAVIAGSALVALAGILAFVPGPKHSRVGLSGPEAAPVAVVEPRAPSPRQPPAKVDAPVLAGAGVGGGGAPGAPGASGAKDEVAPLAREGAAVPTASTPGLTGASRAKVARTTKVAKVAKVAKPTKSTTPAGRNGVGRITRGLSIDPFAEAATRGGRR